MNVDRPRRIGWGVLATGQIAGTFARDLTLLPDDVALVAVASRRLEKAEAFAAEHAFARAYGSYAELAADPDVEVVYVASTHTDHFPSAQLCLEAGKSVLVEKPLTVSPAQTAELIALAGDRGLFLMEAMWTRTNPLIRQAAAVVGSGELGQVRHVSASFGFALDAAPDDRLLDPAQAGGAILDAGVYPVHAATLFLGEPAVVDGFGSHAVTGVDSHAAALLSYPPTDDRPAATASVMCTLEATLPNRLEVYCTDGHILIDDGFLRPAEMLIFRGNGSDVEQEVCTTEWPGGGYTFQAQEVMRCLRSGELQSPMVPWVDTLAVARTLQRWRAAVDQANSRKAAP